jgi:ABC-type bacteriocin/lantibiotic exporter with double-glycine peptidase domain
MYLEISIWSKFFVRSVLLKRYFYRAEQTQMDKKDDRMKVSSEILNAIKYVKMLGQEKFFLKKVNY